MTNSIEVSKLVKTFGPTRALDGLDLSVATGEVHGFLGPNGSGKSTTIRVLLGLLRADSGNATLLGGDPWRDAVKLHRRLAYVPGDVNLWPNLTGGEVIDLLGRLRGSLNKERRADLLERFDLDPTKKGRTLLEGQPPEGRTRRSARVRRRAADPRRTDLRTRSPHGGGLPGVHPRSQSRGANRLAFEPHPGRGGGSVRQGQHHSPRQDGSKRHPYRVATPDADHDRRGDSRNPLRISPSSRVSTTF